MQIANPEVRAIFSLVGIDISSLPSKNPDVVRRHIDTLTRYIGYKAGLECFRKSSETLDMLDDDHAVFGQFIEANITMRPGNPRDLSVFHDMRRVLAIVEGATGYPMTEKNNDSKATMFFLKAIMAEIVSAKNAGVTAKSAALKSPAKM